MLWDTSEAFVDFGPSRYLKRRSCNQLELEETYADMRSQLRFLCPAAPGVYGMIDGTGRLAYVGMSRQLRGRLLTYFQQAANQRKESRIARRVKRIQWETTGHELLALLREHELIRRFLPEMNVRDRRKRTLVYVYQSTEDAPRFRVGGKLPKACRTYWGPVARSRQLVRGVEAFNRYFRLPDCDKNVPMRYRDESRLFEMELYPQCLRGELNCCVAPCSGAISHSQYSAELKRARAFLGGQDDAPLVKIEQAMQRAVAARRFEQAALLRDTQEKLTDLRSRLLPQPDVLPGNFVYPLRSRGRTRWLIVQDGAVVQITSVPCNAHIASQLKTQLRRYKENASPANEQRDAGELRILSAWFRRHPQELERVVDFPSAGSLLRA